ncbi:MAG TPA: SDR family oxidoreductase [Syntrophorhabdaceae bacterium]|nr:SDR family oxidoreductase [Syntrophorhabdaceae bacterium]HQM80226.1 SDR family oxidoreductase [Syntrophorhabdaceae bacterium]
MKLQGKVALITGAGSGFGRATAMLFAREGASIVAVDKNIDAANETAALIRKEKGLATPVQADVSVAADCEKMVKVAVDTYGKLDVLHNNAAIPMTACPVDKIEEDVWDRVIAVNLKSVYLAYKAAIPVMRKGNGGSIINTSSVSGVKVRPGGGVYAVSKAALTYFTKLLALEAAPYKIRVNSISPVASETPLLMGLLNEEQKKDMDATRKAFLSTIPMGRFIVPEDIAMAALYLASDDSFMVTGLDMLVDGGRAI